MVVSNDRNVHHKGSGDEYVDFIYRHPNIQACFKAAFSTNNFIYYIKCSYSFLN